MRPIHIHAPSSAVAVLVLMTGSLVGCSSGSDPEVLKTGDGQSLLVAGDSDGGDDAGVQGVITDVGGCVGIARDVAEHAVVWPAGTKVGEGDALLVLPNGDEVREGDEIRAGAGYYTEPYPDRAPEVPEACRAEEIVIVNNVEVR